MNNFYPALPENYKEAYHINAKNKKTAIIMNLMALLIMAVIALPVFASADWSAFDFDRLLLYDTIFLVGLVLYMVLHELTHGAVYKAMTGRKLTFGLTFSCAYCGVPDIYVSHRTALWALSMPLIVFTLILLPVTLWLASAEVGFYLVSGLLFALHVGGCVGDMYMIWLLLIRYRKKELLMRDTGPEQFIYLPE